MTDVVLELTVEELGAALALRDGQNPIGVVAPDDSATLDIGLRSLAVRRLLEPDAEGVRLLGDVETVLEVMEFAEELVAVTAVAHGDVAQLGWYVLGPVGVMYAGTVGSERFEVAAAETVELAARSYLGEWGVGGPEGIVSVSDDSTIFDGAVGSLFEVVAQSGELISDRGEVLAVPLAVRMAAVRRGDAVVAETVSLVAAADRSVYRVQPVDGSAEKVRLTPGVGPCLAVLDRLRPRPRNG